MKIDELIQTLEPLKNLDLDVCFIDKDDCVFDLKIIELKNVKNLNETVILLSTYK